MPENLKCLFLSNLLEIIYKIPLYGGEMMHQKAYGAQIMKG